ncbi:hypothetical protein AY498_00085 [Corynebacterium ulcerans]|nr:hypothetical protein AFK49_009675 [Corynebacterium ulcerans]PME08303.1 hypothetical protein AY498_00085 [Corynebacterium ulcerans]
MAHRIEPVGAAKTTVAGAAKAPSAQKQAAEQTVIVLHKGDVPEALRALAPGKTLATLMDFVGIINR